MTEKDLGCFLVMVHKIPDVADGKKEREDILSWILEHQV